jgi:hypothetical protein
LRRIDFLGNVYLDAFPLLADSLSRQVERASLAFVNNRDDLATDRFDADREITSAVFTVGIT